MGTKRGKEQIARKDHVKIRAKMSQYRAGATMHPKWDAVDEVCLSGAHRTISLSRERLSSTLLHAITISHHDTRSTHRTPGS